MEPSPKHRGNGRIVSVTVRGQEYDVMIDKDGGYEPDTNAHDVDWHFCDADGLENTLTDDELESVYQQLLENIHWGYEE